MTNLPIIRLANLFLGSIAAPRVERPNSPQEAAQAWANLERNMFIRCGKPPVGIRHLWANPTLRQFLKAMTLLRETPRMATYSARLVRFAPPQVRHRGCHCRSKTAHSHGYQGIRKPMSPVGRPLATHETMGAHWTRRLQSLGRHWILSSGPRHERVWTLYLEPPLCRLRARLLKKRRPQRLENLRSSR
jgi:hypothetical protein